MTSPKDLEYLQELAYMNQVESMQNQIAHMEKEIAELKLSQQQKHPKADFTHDYPSPVSQGKPTEEIISITSNETLIDPPLIIEDKKKPRNHKTTILFSKDYYQAEVSKKEENKPWVLTLKNGQMVIDTHITSHAQLLSSLGNMLNAAVYQKTTNQLPFPLFPSPPPLQGPPDDMATIMSIMMWKKYGKTRYKTYTKYTPRLLQHLSTANHHSHVVPVDGLTSITLRLIYGYMECLHYTQLAFYWPAFTRLFLDNRDVLQSPAALSLCSVICCQSCKHLLNILPIGALPEYAHWYFEQSRDLIADRFDTVDLETLITYTCLGIYRIKQGGPYESAGRYIALAERIHALLKPHYTDNSDEAIFFHRFYRFLWHARSIYDLQIQTASQIAPQRLSELLDDSHLPPSLAPYDTDTEQTFIRMKQHLCQLRRVIKEGGKLAVARDYPTYIAIFSHHIEMGLRHWYQHILPSEFQLSLPLFQDTDDLKFFTVLEGSPAAAVVTTIAAYNEYIIVAKSFIPKEPKETLLETEDLIGRFKEIQANVKAGGKDDKAHHWLKLVSRMRMFRQNEEDEETYFTRFIRALDPSNMRFDMPVTHTAIKAALNVVRLSQFMVSKEFTCFFDVRALLNAWDILVRAVKFKYQQPGDPNHTMDRLRANLLVCLDIVKAYLSYSSRIEHPPLLTDMQNEFNEVFLV